MYVFFVWSEEFKPIKFVFVSTNEFGCKTYWFKHENELKINPLIDMNVKKQNKSKVAAFRDAKLAVSYIAFA